MRLRTHPLASKWTTLIAGLCFAVAGLLGVVTSIPQFDKFAIRQWIEPRPNSPSVTFSGFDPGYTALFCMAVFSLGTGIAASPFLGVTGRRNLSMSLAVLWHGLGIATERVFSSWPRDRWSGRRCWPSEYLNGWGCFRWHWASRKSGSAADQIPPCGMPGPEPFPEQSSVASWDLRSTLSGSVSWDTAD